MTFGYVPPPIAHWLWAQVEPFLLSAITDDDDIADVWSDLKTSHAQLWVARDTHVTGAAVTRRAVIDGRDVVEIWLMGGQMSNVPNIVQIQHAAKDAGAEAMLLHGRKGWLRVLKPYGWQKLKDDGELVIMEVEL